MISNMIPLVDWGMGAAFIAVFAVVHPFLEGWNELGHTRAAEYELQLGHVRADPSVLSLA